MNEKTGIQKFIRFIIKFRWVIFTALFVLTVFFAYNIKHLTVDNDIDSWLPKKDKVAELIREIDREFSSNVMVFTVLDFTEKGVFHPESLELTKRLTEELEGLKELGNVTSLTNIIDIKKTADGIEVGDLIYEIPQTEEDLKQLKEYVLGKEMYVDTVVSADAGYTVVISYVDTGYDEVVVAKMLLDKVQEVVGDHPYYFGGVPALQYYLNTYMNNDFKRLLPAMLFVMVFVLGFGLRRFWGVVFPISFVIICVLWIFGIKAVVIKFPFNIMSPSVAVMLIAIGSDYIVHVYNHFIRRRDIALSMSEIIPPVIMSAVTTIAGLLTFATTKITILEYYGIELAIGLALACILAIIFLPICIYIFRAKPGPVLDKHQIQDHVFSRFLARSGTWSFRHPVITVSITCILMIIAGLGIPRITTNVDYIELLPKDSPPRLGNDVLTNHFSGIYPSSIYFRGDIEAPAVLNRQQYVENFMRSENLLSSFNSINGLIAEENWLLNGIFAIPEDRQGVSNLWFLLEGNEILKTMIKDDRQKSLVRSLIKDSSTESMEYLADYIRDFTEPNVGNKIVRVDPELLPATSQAALEDFRFIDAARQLAWLAARYDKEGSYDYSLFYDRLKSEFENVERKEDPEIVWQKMFFYLQEETVEILPESLIDQIMNYVKSNWSKRDTDEFRKKIEQLIVGSGAMDAEDAELTVGGMMKRAAFSLKLQRVVILRDSLKSVTGSGLWQDNHFVKRSEGVLWGLWDDKPYFFSKQLESIHEIDRAVVETVELEIDSAGVPELFQRVNSLLIKSQINSLIMASIAVFVLVSITQFSWRRGLISLLSVLAPMEIILGIMGWIGIPLDVGTVIFGALIIGLGIDGSIHFLHYYNQLRRERVESGKALAITMGHVGRAIMTANATTCCGFVMLMFSRTSALRNFAYTSGMAIFLVTVSVLAFLPALVVLSRLHVVKPKTKNKQSKT